MHGEFRSENGKSYAFGTITLTFKKSDGSLLKVDDLNNIANSDDGNTDAIYFKYKDGKNNEIERDIRIDQNQQFGDDIRVLFTNTAIIDIKSGFEIYFDLSQINIDSINELELCLSTDYVDAEATVYFIDGKAIATTNKTLYCLDCITGSDTIEYGGTTYVVAHDRITYGYQGNNESYYNGNRQNPPSSLKRYYFSNTTQWSDETGDVFPEKTREFYFWCSECGIGVKDTDYHPLSYHLYYVHGGGASAKSGYINTYKYVQKRVIKLAGCNSDMGNGIKCGTKLSSERELDQQNLSIVTGKKMATEKVTTVPLHIPFITPIDITLEKYNSYNARETNPILLSGAKFEITATQDRNTIISEDVTIGESGRLDYRITPKNTTQPVYVTIKETKAPEGYKVIKEQINIIYTFNSQENKWEANYMPTIEEWVNSGFEQGDFSINVYNAERKTAYAEYIIDVANDNEELEILEGWDLNGDISLSVYLQGKIANESRRRQLVTGWENEFPSTYQKWLITKFKEFGIWTSSDNVNYTSQSGDKITVYANDMLIKVYDEPIKTIKLLKIDEQNKPLKGAAFTGKISNVKSFVLGNQKFTVDWGSTAIDFKNLTIETNENGTIVFEDIVLQDQSKPVVIEIEEISAPDSGSDEYTYKKLSNPIIVTIQFAEDGQVIVQNIKYSGQESISTDIVDQMVIIKVPNIKVNNLNVQLLKTDEEDIPLKGAQFSGTISNVEIIVPDDNLRVNEDGKVEFTNVSTNLNGKIEFSNLKPTSDVIFIEITEVSAPLIENAYYKPLESETISIEIEFVDGKWQKVETISNSKDNVEFNISNTTIQIKIPNQRVIDISGKVWLDGQTGIKPATSYDGVMGRTENGVPGVIVELLENGNVVKQFNNTDAKVITGEDGTYSFQGVLYGRDYTVRFTYDGINYEDTLYKVNTSGRTSDAQEIDRDTFNNKFKTIAYKASNSEDLEYDYIQANNTTQGHSVLKTTNSDGTAMGKYQMQATTASMKLTAHTSNIDLGLVKRGTDVALSTYVTETKVRVNGEETIYKNQSNVKLPERNKNQEVSYNTQNLFTSDYNYRIRDYVNTKDFTNKEYTDNTQNSGNKTGNELEVYVTYELLLLNQSTKNATIDLVEYKYDPKYEFVGLYDENNNKIEITPSNNIIKITGINVNGTTAMANTQKLYKLVFKVQDEYNENGKKLGLKLGEFENTAEIMGYSTNEGLIDIDSQPGNYKDGQPEDDSHKVKMTISKEDEKIRTISGYVGDEQGNKVNDVIVQLIEVKEYAGKVYEYIWQETVSGSNNVKKLTDDGTKIETYTNNINNNQKTGEYEFQGFIPGNYVVRFIYGDGSTYDLTDDVIKYNGQDYKSVADSNYDKEWYDSSLYTEGNSVARDNEARRLETMAYSANVDAKKGVLLKLLDTTDINQFNETEKQTLKIVYEELEENIDEITSEELKVLLENGVLPETWMCAETSKIKVTVDDKENNTIENINLGLTKRPETKIELKKYITGFKLKASNDQVLVNAYMDVNEAKSSENIDTYLTNLNNVKGIKDSLVLLDTVWQYEVSPTEVNTLVDGASLEFDYTLVVRNKDTGAQDSLSNDLTGKYESLKIGDYITYLDNCSKQMKNSMKLPEGATGKTKIGTYLGEAYYIQNKIEQGNVKTEVTNIRDYVNAKLEFINGKDSNGNSVTVVKDESGKNIELTHNILRDNYSMQEIKVNYLKTAATGKMAVDGDAVLYTITLGDDVISSTGTMSFENYIAEVMSYTNAAGRRATSSTPGNAEIIDHEKRQGRAHEIDEAATAKLQIGVETGEDKQTNYIVIASIAAGIAIIGAGVFVTKKYVIK